MHEQHQLSSSQHSYVRSMATTTTDRIYETELKRQTNGETKETKEELNFENVVACYC